MSTEGPRRARIVAARLSDAAAHATHVRQPAPAARLPVGATLFTVVLVGLVALALAGTRSWWFIDALVLIVIAASTFFHLTFPGSRFLAVAFANSMAAYACVFNLFVEANFRGVSTPILVVGFALPIAAFCLAASLRRQYVRAVIEAERVQRGHHIAATLVWLLPVFAIGALTFALPRLGSDETALDAAFIAAMAAIAAVVLSVGPMITAFLVDTSLLFEEFFEQARRAFVAVFAFLTFYSALLIVFAALYRILDEVGTEPNFLIFTEPRDISFAESLYFSVITMATVGYGDITPLSGPARVLSSLQVIVGILLLLFGFSEILSYARDRGRPSP